MPKMLVINQHQETEEPLVPALTLSALETEVDQWFAGPLQTSLLTQSHRIVFRDDETQRTEERPRIKDVFRIIRPAREDIHVSTLQSASTCMNKPFSVHLCAKEEQLERFLLQTTLTFLSELQANLQSLCEDALDMVYSSMDRREHSQIEVRKSELLMDGMSLALVQKPDFLDEGRDVDRPSLKLSNKLRLLRTRKHHKKIDPAKLAIALNPIRRKTGRKPENCICFICQKVCPYKADLIAHFREVHHIMRSKSVLYKRISQGSKTIQRLYGSDDWQEETFESVL